MGFTPDTLILRYPTDRYADTLISIYFFSPTILIFADAIKKSPSQSYLDFILDYVIKNFSGTIVTSVIFFIVAIAAIVYVTKSGGAKK